MLPYGRVPEGFLYVAATLEDEINYIEITIPILCIITIL